MVAIGLLLRAVEDRAGWQHLQQRHGEARQQKEQQRDSEPVRATPRFKPCPCRAPSCSSVVLLASVIACRMIALKFFDIFSCGPPLTGSCTRSSKLVLFEFFIIFHMVWSVLERTSRAFSMFVCAHNELRYLLS